MEVPQPIVDPDFLKTNAEDSDHGQIRADELLW